MDIEHAEASPPPDPQLAELAAISQELRSLRSDIKRAKMYRSPTMTIGWGIVVSTLLWIALGFIVVVGITLLGLSVPAL